MAEAVTIKHAVEYLLNAKLEDLSSIKHWSCLSKPAGRVTGKVVGPWECETCQDPVRCLVGQEICEIWPKLVVAVEDDTSIDALHALCSLSWEGMDHKRIRAFDREWIVPHGSYATTGAAMDILCERLEKDGLLTNSLYAYWSTGDTDACLIRNRPAFWRSISNRHEFLLDWDRKVPPATTAGPWRYYIEQDVCRHLPSPMTCPVCGSVESEEWEPVELEAVFYCGHKCHAEVYERYLKRLDREYRWRKREGESIRRGRQKLKEVRKYLRDCRSNCNQKGASA